MIALNHFIRQRGSRSVFRGVGGVVAHVILFLSSAGRPSNSPLVNTICDSFRTTKPHLSKQATMHNTRMITIRERRGMCLGIPIFKELLKIQYIGALV